MQANAHRFKQQLALELFVPASDSMLYDSDHLVVTDSPGRIGEYLSLRKLCDVYF